MNAVSYAATPPHHADDGHDVAYAIPICVPAHTHILESLLISHSRVSRPMIE